MMFLAAILSTYKIAPAGGEPKILEFRDGTVRWANYFGKFGSLTDFSSPARRLIFSVDLFLAINHMMEIVLSLKLEQLPS
jgi:hypothetical protein